MNVATFLVYCIVFPDNPEERLRRFRATIDCGITVDDFPNKQDADLFSFVSNYTMRHQFPPSLSIVEIETNIRFDNCIDGNDFEYWLDRIQEYRRNIVLGTNLAQISRLFMQKKHDLVQEQLINFTEQWSKIYRRRNIVALPDALDAAIVEHDELQHNLKEPGIEFGFPFIDSVTGGIRGGDIALVIGESGSGKTYILCRSAEHAANKQKRVLFVSMEMTSTQISRRIGALGAHIDGMSLRLGILSGFAMRRLRDYVETIRKRDPSQFMLVEGTMSVNISDLLLYVREFKPDVLYIDGAYMLKPSAGATKKQRWEQLLDAIEELKNLALNERVAIIASMQFKRKGAKEGLEGIGYSYAVAQAASLALAIREPENSDLSLDFASEYRSQAYKVLEIIKGREGESGAVLLRYDLQRAFIEEVKVINGDAPVGFDDPEETMDDDFLEQIA